jgi:O-antigen/teichoic acid export membrane protein
VAGTTKGPALLARIFSDRSLTRKAYLNALAGFVDYGVQLLVGLIVTPLVVAGLGDFFYGVWRILNTLVGYISPSSGKPTVALKYTLANRQGSDDHDEKRRYVGSAVAVWVLFLPLMVACGAILTWFAPYWLKTPEVYFWEVRWVAGLLVANLAVTSLSMLPQSVLQGENLGYKRIGLSATLVILGGVLTWMALYFKMGIVGVAGASLVTVILTGLFFYRVVRTYAPWFGIARPSFDEAWQFLSLSWWFLGWNLVYTLLSASDVVVLGRLNSVESVTPYSLTKYAPETLMSVIAIVVFGIIPGLGGIIGSRNLQKAVRVRSEIMSLSWLIMAALGFSILLWNRAFINMWVGADRYAGTLPNLLIVVVVTQFVLIRNDASIIDLTLDLRHKVMLGFVCAVVSIGLASMFVAWFKLGVVGLTLGIILGRSILSLSYPLLVGRFLGYPLPSQLRGVGRPALVTVVLFALAAWMDTLPASYMGHGIRAWVQFFAGACLTCTVTLIVAFYAGLTMKQRNDILRRVRSLLEVSS